MFVPQFSFCSFTHCNTHTHTHTHTHTQSDYHQRYVRLLVAVPTGKLAVQLLHSHFSLSAYDAPCVHTDFHLTPHNTHKNTHSHACMMRIPTFHYTFFHRKLNHTHTHTHTHTHRYANSFFLHFYVLSWWQKKAVWACPLHLVATQWSYCDFLHPLLCPYSVIHGWLGSKIWSRLKGNTATPDNLRRRLPAESLL